MTMNVVVVFAALLSLALGQMMNETEVQNACQSYGTGYGNNGYCNGAMLAASNQNVCNLTCKFRTTTVQQYSYYPYYYGANSLQSCQGNPKTTTVQDTTLTYALNRLEKCGTNMVCISGSCVAVNPTDDADCKINFGSRAVAAKSTNPCQVACVNVVMGPQYPYSTQQVASFQYYNVSLPNQTPCGRKGLCFGGDCFTGNNLPASISC